MTTVVVPYVAGMLDPETRMSVEGSGLPHVWCELDRADEGAYGRLVRRIWAEGRTFVICEHDVVPTWQQWAAISRCGHDWCSYSYDDNLYPDAPMFGLARFSGRVLRHFPHAAERALTRADRQRWESRACDDALEARRVHSPWTGMDERRWWAVDNAIARDLQIRGVRPFMHKPNVHHRHHGPPSGPA